MISQRLKDFYRKHIDDSKDSYVAKAAAPILLLFGMASAGFGGTTATIALLVSGVFCTMMLAVQIADTNVQTYKDHVASRRLVRENKTGETVHAAQPNSPALSREVPGTTQGPARQIKRQHPSVPKGPTGPSL